MFALHKYHPKFIALMNAIPDSSDPDSGTHLVNTFASVISSNVQTKDPQQIVDEHDTDTVFEHGKDPSAKTIKKSWWETRSDTMPQFLVRSLFPLGPARKMTPPYFNRSNQGILCQPHAENNNLRPIEFVANYVNRIFCRASTTDEPMDAADVMNGFVEIFTSTQPVHNHEIDDLSFVFVKGKDLKPVCAKRLDIVHALRVLFYSGYLVFFANPTAFKWCHPVFLITNVFLAQTNFFPPNSDMDQPLSDAEKNNYLLALGLNIYEAMRKPFDAEFFLNSYDIFPSTINPTTMPTMGNMGALLGLSYVPAAHAAPTPLPNDDDDIFTPLHFLFGKQVPDHTTEDDITAEVFDHYILHNYTAVHDKRDEQVAQLDTKQLKILLTIICPKSTLKLQNNKNYGIKSKKAMVELLQKHTTDFDTSHADYLAELKDTNAPA